MSSSTLQTLGQSNNNESLESPKEEDTIVEFDGDHDTWDPKNFSNIKKWLILSAVTHGAFIVIYTSSLCVFHSPATVLISDCMLYSTRSSF